MEGAAVPSRGARASSRRPLERVTAGGESPVGERVTGDVMNRDVSRRRTREIRVEAGGTTPQG